MTEGEERGAVNGEGRGRRIKRRQEYKGKHSKGGRKE